MLGLMAFAAMAIPAVIPPPEIGTWGIIYKTAYGQNNDNLSANRFLKNVCVCCYDRKNVRKAF
jgi:hypothetical protein